MRFDPAALVALLAVDRSIVGNPPEADPLPNVYNGMSGVPDMNKPTDYVKDMGKVVLVDGNFHLGRTAAYRLWVIQGKPTAETPISQEHLNVFMPELARLVARGTLYGLMTAVGQRPVFRNSDAVPRGTVPADCRHGTDICRLYEFMISNAQCRDMIAEQGQMILYSMVANAAHRRMFEGHSWYTEDAKDSNSVQAKLYAVAGRNKKAFKQWMESGDRAHDENHHLSDVSLHQIAMGIAGKSAAHAVTAVAPSRGPPAVEAVVGVGNSEYEYNGAIIGERYLNAFLASGDAAASRYPPGELGKAALIVGLEMMIAMVDHITTRVLVEGSELINVNLERMATSVRAESFPAAVAREMDVALGRVLSVTCGYVLRAAIMRADRNKAFQNHAERHAAAVAMGKSLASALEDVTPHDEAITAKVVNTLAGLANAVAAASSITYVRGTAEVQVSTCMDVDVSKIKAKVGKSSDDRMLDMLKVAGRGGGDTFYDAASP